MFLQKTNNEQTPQKADKAAVEKELSEIEALLKSVNNDRGQVLADRYNSVVGPYVKYLQTQTKIILTK